MQGTILNKFIIHTFPFTFPPLTMNNIPENTGYADEPSAVAIDIRTPYFSNNGYGWRHNQTIDDVFAGSYEPASAEEAEELLQERFGAVYKVLPETFRRNPRLLLIAVAQSAGHELKHAPEDMRAQLKSRFFIEALRLGARSWILQWANDAVKNDPEVVAAAAHSDAQVQVEVQPACESQNAISPINTRSAETRSIHSSSV